jgi:hypothetical protein
MWNKKIEEKIDKLNSSLENFNERQFAYMLGSRKEIFRRNLLAGIARGLGMTIGLAIVTAVAIYVLQKVLTLNLPLIGDYIVEILDIVEKKR